MKQLFSIRLNLLLFNGFDFQEVKQFVLVFVAFYLSPSHVFGLHVPNFLVQHWFEFLVHPLNVIMSLRLELLVVFFL